ncbi:MAG: insulinase family protein [candidate division Zixibacteria bacterium]|nr:insulinase family protein [candidate division Zixibacteria bacterium]
MLCCQSEPVDKLEVPKVKEKTLANGLRVYLLEDHRLPLFNISVRIAAGSYLEPADKVGLASIMGDVMRTGGSKKWTGDEMDERLEAVGASVESSMGLTSGSASGNSLIEYSGMVLEILAEILRNPTFDQDKIDITKTQVKGGISRRNDNAQGIASRIFNQILYGAESPYARTAEYATVDAISREDLIEFHGKYVHPKNLQLAVWGDFKESDMLKDIEKRFASWESEGEAPPPPPEVTHTQSVRTHYAEKTDVNQSNIFIGHLGGKIQDEDYPTRLVMNNILGGGFGSRLFSNVRSRKGLAYATGGGYRAHLAYPGRFFGFASTKSETTLEAARAVIEQIESMQTVPPTEEEMTIAIDGYLNSFVFNFDTRGEVVNRMVQYDAYGLPQDFLSQVKEKVQVVTAEAVQAVAKKRLHVDNMHIVVVGKGEDFDGKLEELGLPVDTVDITIPSGAPESEIVQSHENLARGKVIVGKAIEATGGKSVYEGISSFSMKMDVSIEVGGGQLMTLSGSVLTQLPDKQALTLQTPGGEMKMTYDGAQGWRTMRGQSQPLPETEIDKNKKDMARTLVILLATTETSGYTPVYGGAGDVNGTSVEFVYFVDGDGNEPCKVGFDAGNFMPVSQHYFGETNAGPANLDVYYSNYQDVSGLKTPFNVKRMANGTVVDEMTIKEMELNTKVTASTFADPTGG